MYKTLEPRIESKKSCPDGCPPKYCDDGNFKKFAGECSDDQCCRCASSWGGLGIGECASGCRDSEEGECVFDTGGGGDPCEDKPKGGCWTYNNEGCMIVSNESCNADVNKKIRLHDKTFDSCDSCQNYADSQPGPQPGPPPGPQPQPGPQPGPHPDPHPGPLVPPPDWSGSAGLHFYNYLKNKLLTDFSVNYPKMTDKVKVVSCLLNNFCKGNNPKKVMSLLLALNKSNGTTPPPYIIECIKTPDKNDPGNPTGLGGGGPSSGHHFWTSTWGIILIIMLSVLGLCLIAAIIFEIVKKRKLR